MSKAITEAVVMILNTFDGWDMEYKPSDEFGYDAFGKTPKEFPCVMKFKYDNQEPWISREEYDKLMKVHDGVTILYVYVNSTINYMFWFPQAEYTEEDGVLWLNKQAAKLINFGERIL